MASRKIIDRVEKLIALAGSNNENEARNAAYLAAKLIREHKLTFAEEDSFEVFQRAFNERRQARRDPPARPAPPPPPTRTPPPDEDIDWGTSRARPKEVTDEEAEDLFRDWKPSSPQGKSPDLSDADVEDIFKDLV